MGPIAYPIRNPLPKGFAIDRDIGIGIDRDIGNELTPVPATEVHYAARARNLPERPEPSASFDVYVAYLDAMCAHVRGMAVKAGRLYHEAKLAELEGAR